MTEDTNTAKSRIMFIMATGLLYYTDETDNTEKQVYTNSIVSAKTTLEFTAADLVFVKASLAKAANESRGIKNVKHIVITNITPLGMWTPEEFNNLDKVETAMRESENALSNEQQ